MVDACEASPARAARADATGAARADATGAASAGATKAGAAFPRQATVLAPELSNRASSWLARVMLNGWRDHPMRCAPPRLARRWYFRARCKLYVARRLEAGTFTETRLSLPLLHHNPLYSGRRRPACSPFLPFDSTGLIQLADLETSHASPYHCS
jgi:hypothetical protein